MARRERNTSGGCRAAAEISHADDAISAVADTAAKTPSSQARADRDGSGLASASSRRTVPNVPARAVTRHHLAGSAQLDHAINGVGHGPVVHHEQHAAPFGELTQARQHALPCRTVEVGRRLVEQQQARPPPGAQHGPGKRDPLTLTRRDPGSVLAEQGARVEVACGQPQRRGDVGIRRVRGGRTERDVVRHGAGEQRRALRSPGDLRPPRLRVGLGEVHPAP